ncbi:metal ion transporter metal ion transporter [Thelonectria olida]|uniref:Metal ion transporter metal ion transporter n=1 Tax=Thelonectria olida TaxID=1576542 RepID=A0A9P9AMS3_9HYPO|nr:metal ion transporter metal ion transporter [Thelonectria olida]
MNRTSRTEEPYQGDGLNQSPNPLSNDLTTNEDLNGLVNSRQLKRDDNGLTTADPQPLPPDRSSPEPNPKNGGASSVMANETTIGQRSGEGLPAPLPPPPPSSVPRSSLTLEGRDGPTTRFERVKIGVAKYGSFVGPGFMIAVAYIDPGNYSTDVAAGASYQFRLLFVVLLSNLFAILLQSLCIKLGTVTGLNLAEACRAFLPRWLNIVLYLFAEAAIIATDIAEVIGFAIGLNLLAPKVPLVVGCAISILDVMIILLFYRPHGSMRGLRVFEYFIVCLVLAVVVCFCVQLSLIEDTPVGHVFKGYLPSKALVEQKGLYQACGILGATVMPHSLYLGSGIVQPRLRAYDEKHGLLPPDLPAPSINENGIDKGFYIPSLAAIRYSIRFSIIELAISLFTFALFVNSAILIVAGVSLYGNENAADADIFSIHKLLSDSVSPVAGTIFALALLLSGVSAGIVCTIAGQMVSEGALNWKMRPWLRRLMTRSISITPSIIIAGAVGRSGLTEALNASQVVLSIVLPFVTAPLIYFTCCKKYMTVQSSRASFPITVVTNGRTVADAGSGPNGDGNLSMANSWWIAGLAILVWIIIAAMNVANLVLLGKGD